MTRTGKSCCAVGCANSYFKSAGIPFYHYPTDPERKHLWIAAVRIAGLHTGVFLWGRGGEGENVNAHINAASRGSGGMLPPENFI